MSLGVCREQLMELWMDLLFGNWIGLMSVITVGLSFAVIVFIVVMFYIKSHQA